MPNDRNTVVFPFGAGKTIGMGPVPGRSLWALYIKEGATVHVIGYLRHGELSQKRLADALRDLCRYWEDKGRRR